MLKPEILNHWIVPQQEKFHSEIDEEPKFALPSGWTVVSLAELADVLNGRAYAKSELLDAGTPVLRVGNLFTSRNWYYSNLTLDEDKYCDEGDLIFSWSASFGPFIWTGPKVIYHYHIWKLRLHSETRLDKNYLYRFLLQQTQQIKESGHGVSMIHMTKEKMEKLLVPLPPLAEQHRIVAKVDELMALCDQLEAAQQERERRRDRLAAASLQRLNQPAADTSPEAQREHARFHLHQLPRLTTRPEHIKAMRQTILNFAVHGWLVPQLSVEGLSINFLQEALAARRATWETEQVAKAKAAGKALVRDWQKKYTNPVHEQGLFELPKDWVWASTLEICLCVENGNTPQPNEMSENEGEIPFIKVYNLTKSGELDFTIRPTFITKKVHENKLQRSRIAPQDVLMNIVGPPLGKVSLVTDQFPEWNTNQAVVLFRPSKVLLSKYLKLCLLSDAVLTWITRLAQATVGQSNISVSKSRALPIPLPPVAEQHRIVAKVDELMALCDQLEAQLSTTQTDSRRLLESVLEAALVPE